MSLLLTSFLEAAALCNGVNHIWSLAFTLAPGRQNHISYLKGVMRMLQMIRAIQLHSAPRSMSVFDDGSVLVCSICH